MSMKTWFKVVGHRPFDSNCMSMNVINAKSASEARTAVTDSYGFRDDEEKHPNIIIDEVSEVKA